MTEQPPASLAPALDLLRRGDRPAPARADRRGAGRASPTTPALLAFAGLLAAQIGRSRGGAIPISGARWRSCPAISPTRVNLATALVATGALDEAAELLRRRRRRSRGCCGSPAYVHQQQGRLAEAAAAYEAVVAAFPGRFRKLEQSRQRPRRDGRSRRRDRRLPAGDRAQARRRRDRHQPSEVLAAAERDEERQRGDARGGAGRARTMPQVQTELGLAEAAMRDFEAAETRLSRRRSGSIPRLSAAYLELGLLLENLNRVDELDGAGRGRPRRAGWPGAELGFIEAWSLRRQGRFDEALPLAEAMPATIHPVRRSQLIAEIARPARRCGARLRRLRGDEPRLARGASRRRPGRPIARRSRPTPRGSRRNGSRPGRTDRGRRRMPPAPIFIVGFPRSGTTLLDTLLMNMPDLACARGIAGAARGRGGARRRGPARAGGARTRSTPLRARYFEALDSCRRPRPGQTWSTSIRCTWRGCRSSTASSPTPGSSSSSATRATWC